LEERTSGAEARTLQGFSFFGEVFSEIFAAVWYRERSFDGLPGRPSFSAHVRPTARRGRGANVGHPSRERGLRLDGQSLSLPARIPPLKPRSINVYLCDALH
jgi:hypothetical protein